MSSKLDAVLRQQSTEREELQEQLHSLTQQLADTQDQVAHLQQVRCQHGTRHAATAAYQARGACQARDSPDRFPVTTRQHFTPG